MNHILCFHRGCQPSYQPLNDFYLNWYGFRAEFDFFDITDTSALYYCAEDHITLVCARSKAAIDLLTANTLRVSGDIPFYRSKHYIQNKVFFTAMYDISINIIPPTTN